MVSDTPAIEQATSHARENQLRWLISVVSRHWRMIVVFSVLGMLAYGIFGLFFFKKETTFEATTQLIVRQSPWDKNILRTVAPSQLVDTSPKALIERVNRQSVAEAVVRSLVNDGVAEGFKWGKLASFDEVADATAQINGLLELTPVQESGLITVKARGATADEAKLIADHAARAFIKIHGNLLVNEEKQTHEFVQNQLGDLRTRLDAAENAEWQFRKDELGFRTHDQVVKDMETMRSELLSAEARREEIMGKMAELESQLQEKDAKLPTSLGQINDRVVNQLFEELADLLQEQLTMSVVYQPDYEPLQQLRDEIAEKEQAILAAIGQLDSSPQSGADMWEDRQKILALYRNLQLELVSLEVGVGARSKMLKQMEEDLPTLATKGFEYDQLAREAEQLRKQFDDLLSKEFEVKTAIRRGVGEVERHTPVTVHESLGPGSRVRTWINFVIGAAVGFALGFGLACMLEMLDTSIRGIEDVTEYIGIEVIGTIPLMRFGKPKRGRRHGNYIAVNDEEQIDACIVTHYDPKSPVSEAYRTLRTNFQFATIQQKPKTVMVTSAVPGEGKTTTAVNMAVTLADIGMRVLLIDTDLRRPHVHHVLKMERGPGLADVLREGIDPREVIRPTRVENLWIVSSGRVPPNPSELIGSTRMERLMHELGAEFDIVICDAPSILVVTDPVLLATHVDTVVMVVSANNARRETIVRAKKLMETAKAHVAGVVLNGLEATRRHYYYYYYYYEDSKSRRQRRWYHL